MSKTKIGNDLQNHVIKQLRKLVLDAADTYRRAGIDDSDSMAYILGALTRETVIGMTAVGMKEGEAVDAFRVGFRDVRKILDGAGLTDDVLLAKALELAEKNRRARSN